MADDREASWRWIRERVSEFATTAGVVVDADLKRLAEGGEILHVVGHRQRVTEEISDGLLTDLHNDADAQKQMDDRLRAMIAKIPKVGDRVIVERFNGLFDVEKVTEPGEVVKARTDLKTLDQAREIARGHVESGGRVWFLRHGAIELQRL